MIDQFNRQIDYIRISLTQRCNLRCQYCMPNGISLCSHNDILTYEEILRLCSVFTKIGIKKFKITGGEPFVRKNAIDFIQNLKSLEGVEQVTLTTNGTLLDEYLPQLANMNIDGINISLDTLDKDLYFAITGQNKIAPSHILESINHCVKLGIKTKINAVISQDTLKQSHQLALLGKSMPIDVRFIEIMPLGGSKNINEPTAEKLIAHLEEHFGKMPIDDTHHGNGPAVYYKLADFKGSIGVISSMTHSFCNSCNRIRLTSTGILKPCLCYNSDTNLLAMLRNNATDQQILEVVEKTIYEKPKSHCFSNLDNITENKAMNTIGG